MAAPPRVYACLVLAWLAASAPPAFGATRAACEKRYAPQRAQEGKDVVWVPTADAMVTRMLTMAGVTAEDVVYDLGSGDGKIPIAAAKQFGATAVGIEYDARLVRLARCLVRAERLQKRVEIVQADIFATNFDAATVVALYLLPALNLRLRPTLLAMQPGTRVVSYSFTMGDWQPDDFVDTDDGSAYFWIVPANVAGAWRFRPVGGGGEVFDVVLAQAYQKLEGSAGGAGVTGRVAGDAVELDFGSDADRTHLAGTLEAGVLRATVTRAGGAREYVGARP